MIKSRVYCFFKETLARCTYVRTHKNPHHNLALTYFKTILA